MSDTVQPLVTISPQPTPSQPLTTSQALASLDPVEAAGEAIRGYCDWHISPVLQTVRRFYRMPSGLPTRRLASVDSIVFDDGTPVDSASVDAYENGNLYVLRKFGWDQRGPVTISFTHGFETTPADIVGVLGSLTRRAVLEAARGLTTGPFQIQANGAVTADFDPYEMKILEKYRVVPFA